MTMHAHVDRTDHPPTWQVTDLLFELWPNLVAASDPLWLTSPHATIQELDSGLAASCSLSLPRLEAELAAVPLLSMLPPELHRAVRRRQLAFLGGRLCAERALAQLGVGADVIGRGTIGEPLWPPEVHGSISHSDSAAHAVVARSIAVAGIGIDSESIICARTANDIAAMCCTPNEFAHCPELGLDPLRLTLLFSAKEAFYKAVFPIVRRFIDFQEVETLVWDDMRSEVLLGPVAGTTLAGQAPRVRARWLVEEGVQSGVHTVVVVPSFGVSSS